MFHCKWASGSTRWSHTIHPDSHEIVRAGQPTMPTASSLQAIAARLIQHDPTIVPATA